LTALSVCFVCDEYPPGPHGGIGTLVQVLARDLARLGHHVRVVGTYLDSYPGPEYEVDQGVEVWRLREPRRRLGWVAGRRQLYRTVAHWCRAGEVDVVEVADWGGRAAWWPALPVPVVARLNGSATYFAAELGRRVARTSTVLEQASLRRADVWCSCSRYTAERTKQLLGLREKPTTILYNFVDVPDAVPDTWPERRHVVFTGTLAAKKGVVSLIEAWPHVAAACGGAELHLFGKDDRSTEGSSMREHLGARLQGPARASVHFHGHVPRERVFSALQGARVAVFPSYAEAFAFAPLEAMAYGCATVYSRRGSGPELISHGEHGLLVDPDRPDEIAEAIICLLQDDRLARRLGAAGRERVAAAFSQHALVAQNEAFYRECVAEFRRRRGPTQRVA